MIKTGVLKGHMVTCTDGSEWIECSVDAYEIEGELASLRNQIQQRKCKFIVCSEGFEWESLKVKSIVISPKIVTLLKGAHDGWRMIYKLRRMTIYHTQFYRYNKDGVGYAVQRHKQYQTYYPQYLKDAAQKFQVSLP